MKCRYFREWALYGIKPVPSKPSVRQYWWPSVNSVTSLLPIVFSLFKCTHGQTDRPTDGKVILLAVADGGYLVTLVKNLIRTALHFGKYRIMMLRHTHQQQQSRSSVV